MRSALKGQDAGTTSIRTAACRGIAAMLNGVDPRAAIAVLALLAPSCGAPQDFGLRREFYGLCEVDVGTSASSVASPSR